MWCSRNNGSDDAKPASAQACGPSSSLGRIGDTRGREILDATRELLLEVGYDRLTFDAVAARARASKATLYRHWPTKVDLVGDAMAPMADHRGERIDSGSFRGDLDAMVEAVLHKPAGQVIDLVTALGTAARTSPELAQALRERVLIPLIDDLAEIFGRAQARGELCPEMDIRFVSSVIPAMLAFHLCAEGSQGEPSEVLRRVVDEVLLPLSRATAPDSLPTSSGQRRPVL